MARLGALASALPHLQKSLGKVVQLWAQGEKAFVGCWSVSTTTCKFPSTLKTAL